MKKIITPSTYFVLSLLTLVMFQSCTKEIELSNEESSKQSSLSVASQSPQVGREMYRAIYFSHGNLYQTLDAEPSEFSLISLCENDQQKYQDAVSHVTGIMNWISTNHSDFFQDFCMAMSSGSHLTISEMLEQGATYTNDAIVALYPDSLEGIDDYYTEVNNVFQNYPNVSTYDQLSEAMDEIQAAYSAVAKKQGVLMVKNTAYIAVKTKKGFIALTGIEEDGLENVYIATALQENLIDKIATNFAYVPE